MTDLCATTGNVMCSESDEPKMIINTQTQQSPQSLKNRARGGKKNMQLKYLHPLVCSL